MKKTAAVITISDKGARGEREDTSGPAICQRIKEKGYTVVYTQIIPDEQQKIQNLLIRCADEENISLILTTGGTGFSPRDLTPEATLAVIERETPGIPEAMRLASLTLTPRGCLSRSAAGIRKKSLIINLPGSKKAAMENLEAVLDAIDHGIEMLHSAGSADCAERTGFVKEKASPSMEEWLKEAKKDIAANQVGMYLTHNGVVRKTAKALVRGREKDTKEVKGMLFSYHQQKVEQVINDTKRMEGIYYIRVWLNEGELKVGDDIMYVLIGGDIRPNVEKALDYLVGRIKEECVTEQEIS